MAIAAKIPVSQLRRLRRSRSRRARSTGTHLTSRFSQDRRSAHGTSETQLLVRHSHRGDPRHSVRPKRGRFDRVSGVRRRTRSCADPPLDRRPQLDVGAAVARAVLHANGRLLPSHDLRQARHGNVGSRAGSADARGEDGRRPCGNGRSRIRTRDALGRRRGRANDRREVRGLPTIRGHARRPNGVICCVTSRTVGGLRSSATACCASRRRVWPTTRAFVPGG